MNFQAYTQTVLLRARPMPPADQVRHALVVMITEVGELGDIFKREMAYGKAVDNVNVMEECGDFLWYFALLLDTCGVHARTLDEMPLFPPEGNEGPGIGLDCTFALAYLTGNLGIETAELRKVFRSSENELIKGALSTVSLLLNHYGGYTMGQCLDKNDAKLELRTGKKFDAAAILNRDTAAERASLES